MKFVYILCNIWCGFKDLIIYGKIFIFDIKEKVRYMYFCRDMFIVFFFICLIFSLVVWMVELY